MQYSSQQILDGVPDALIVADLSGQIVAVNTALCGLLGYAQGELVGRALNMLGADPNSRAGQSALDAVTAGGHHRWHREDFVTRSGHSLPVELQPGVITDESGGPSGAVFVVRVVVVPKGNLPKSDRPRRRSSPRGRR